MSHLAGVLLIGSGEHTYLNLLKASVHPVKQLAEGVKGQGFHGLQAGADDHLLPGAPVQTEALVRGAAAIL